MAVAPHILQAMNSSSTIRKAFEEGLRLKAQYGADNVYDFSLGNPDLEPPKEVYDVMRELAAEKQKGVHGYMPNPGYAETREAMAQKVSGEQDVTLTKENIIMSVGAAGGLNAVLKAILSPEDEVIVPAPFFAEYTHYCKNHGGTLVPVPTNDDFSLNIDTIKSALSAKTAAVLINSPNNPTGKIYTTDDIAHLASALKAHGKACNRTPYLIADEPYRDITYDNRTVAPIFPIYQNAIVVSSFAKNLSIPGERIGFIAINPACEDCAELTAACVFATRTLGYVNAPAFFQRVIAKTWNAPVDFSSYRARRDALTAILDKAGIEYARPEGAFYLFCRVPASKNGRTPDENAFCEHLQTKRILAVPGTGFGKKGWFRLAYCVSSQTIQNSAASFTEACQTW